MPGDSAFSSFFMGLSTASATLTSPKMLSSCSSVTPPGLRSTGISVARVITVDSTPTSQSPPLQMASALPVMSASTWSKLVGLGKPEIFAEGAARGHDRAMIFLATS